MRDVLLLATVAVIGAMPVSASALNDFQHITRVIPIDRKQHHPTANPAK